jgi:hypothetical protein
MMPGGSIHRIQETNMATCHIPRNLVHTLPGDDRSGATDPPA